MNMAEPMIFEGRIVDCIDCIFHSDGLFVWGNETLRISIPVDAKWKRKKEREREREREREEDMPAIITDYFHLNSDFSFRNVKAVNYVIYSKFNRPLVSFSQSLELEGKNQLKGYN